MSAGLAAILAACGPVASRSPATTPEPTVTPAPTPTPTPTGPLAAIRLACWAALQPCQMAVDRFNAQTGGIMGVKVEAGEVSGGVASLATDRTVLGIAGPPDGGSALRAGPAIDAAQLGFVSPSATAAKVTGSGWRTAHRLIARDDLTGPAAAEFAFGPPIYARSAYVLDSGDVDSTGLADEFQKRATALGTKVKRDSLAGSAGDPAEAARIASAKPAVLFFPDGGAHCDLLALVHQRAPAIHLLLTPGCAGATPDGAYVVDGRLDRGTTPAEQAWAKDYAAQFGAEPGPFDADAFDAANVVLLAIERAASAKGSLYLKPANVNVELGRTVGFNGLAGAISFDPLGDLVHPSVAIEQMSGGGLKPVRVVAAA